MNIEELNKILRDVLADIPDHICIGGQLLKDNDFYSQYEEDCENFYLALPFCVTVEISKLD